MKKRLIPKQCFKVQSSRIAFFGLLRYHRTSRMTGNWIKRNRHLCSIPKPIRRYGKVCYFVSTSLVPLVRSSQLIPPPLITDDAELEPSSSTSHAPPTRLQQLGPSSEADKNHQPKERQEQTAAQANTASNLQGCGDHDIGAAAVRNVFKARGMPPLRDDNGEFGPAVEAPDGYEGCTSYRSIQFSGN